MSEKLLQFEQIIRKASRYTEAKSKLTGGLHPFDERNIHPILPAPTAIHPPGGLPTRPSGRANANQIPGPTGRPPGLEAGVDPFPPALVSG